jgi:hypothetical protein
MESLGDWFAESYGDLYPYSDLFSRYSMASIVRYIGRIGGTSKLGSQGDQEL